MTPLHSDRSGGLDFIEVKWHERKYDKAVQGMIRQSLLPLAGDRAMPHVLSAYRSYMTTDLGNMTLHSLYRDVVLLSAWARDSDGASRILKVALPKLDKKRNAYRFLGGRERFVSDCQAAIETPTTLDQTVERDIEALRLQRLPVSELIQ